MMVPRGWGAAVSVVVVGVPFCPLRGGWCGWFQASLATAPARGFLGWR